MKTYNWEGVNPDGYFLDKLEPIPSGLTPSQLYVFMPPNLGGFFMVRSYYPLNVTLIILTLSVSRLLNLLLRLVAFLLFLNPQCLASISRWITASSSWKRFCLFVCRALSSIMVICMLTAIRLLLTFVMSLYLLLRS